MTLTLSAWVFYAYRNPNSASGIWLIEVNYYFAFILFDRIINYHFSILKHRPQRIFSMINNNIKRETSRSTRFENPEV